MEEGGEFEVQEFTVGKTQRRPVASRAWPSRAPDPATLDRILEGSTYLGAATVVGDASFAPAEADGILPDEFYSTTNFDTLVRIDGTLDGGRATRRWTARSSCATASRAA